MKSHPLIRVVSTVAVLATLGSLGFAVQRPKPAPAPAPAPTPAQDEKQKEEEARKQRVAAARKAEAERQAQEAQEAERVKRARQEASEAERVKRAREEAGQGDPNTKRVAAARAELNEVAAKMLEIEGVHRDRLARLDRILAIYRESGDQAKLEEVEALKRRENKRYLLIIDQFKVKLGPAYAQYEPRLLAGQQRRADASQAPGKEPAAASAPAPRRVPKPSKDQPTKDQPKGGGR